MISVGLRCANPTYEWLADWLLLRLDARTLS